MAPPSARRAFVETLRKVAERHGFEFIALSRDWIIQITDPGTGRRCNVFGYTFDVNPAGAIEICKEKAASSLVLAQHGVPNIPHHVFLSPSNEFTAEYLPRSGNWTGMQQVVQECGFPVVLKTLKGTGGLDVIRATCWKEVEAAVQHLFNREYGLAISPYKRIVDEYRCVCLDGKVELVYKKLRSTVIGDGTSTVAALAAQMLAAADSKAVPALAKAIASMSVEDLGRVPVQGETIAVQWKHNLGQGATASFDIREDMKARLVEMAPRAAGAIGVRFCSVDIVDVEGEGLMIMEVNGGVMMDALMSQLGDCGEELAYRLYETAVLRALGRPD